MFPYFKNWQKLNKTNKFKTSAIILMQAAFVAAIAISIYEKVWLSVFVSVAALMVVWLPSLIEKNYRVHYPLEFGFLLNLFIYASIFLGELRGYYTRF